VTDSYKKYFNLLTRKKKTGNWPIKTQIGERKRKGAEIFFRGRALRVREGGNEGRRGAEN